MVDVVVRVTVEIGVVGRRGGSAGVSAGHVGIGVSAANDNQSDMGRNPPDSGVGEGSGGATVLGHVVIVVVASTLR